MRAHASTLLFLALALSACDAATPIGRACETDSDCDDDQVCIDSACATAPPDHDGGGDDDDAGPPRDSGPGRDSGSAPRCGDGRLRTGEICDDGNTDSGDGCSDTCTIEPGYACPTPNEACTLTAVCGDGTQASTEACDDRNVAAGDGCSATCAIESGWACPSPGLPCVAEACGDGVIAGTEDCEDGEATPDGGDGCDASCHFEEGYACDAPGTPCRRVRCGDGVREGTEQCDDGDNDLGDGCDPFCKREPMCSGGTCTAVCGDAIRLPGEGCDDGNVRDGDGCSATCAEEDGFDCTDDGATDPTSVSIPIVYRDFRGADLSGGHPDFEDDTGAVRGIVATMLGADGKPVYVGGDTTHGAGPFDQWYRDVSGTNLTVVERLTLGRIAAGSYEFDSDEFFPLDDKGWVAMSMEPEREDGDHNFSFTSELRYWFEYAGGEQLNFRGDDDVWVFINGRLALDLGGVHGPESGSITLDAARAATLGLTVGGIYEAVVFQAERHTSQSSYRLTLRGFNATRSDCDWTCGDGIVTRFEICDDMVNDGSYGHCAPGCLAWGPRCGDAHVDTGEACDDGANLGGYNQCAAGCVLGPRCGDGVQQADRGEMCDDGNAVPEDGCSPTCQDEIG